MSAEHMQARRDQIAQAAASQFAKRGIHSTSMANIIDASGLSAGAIYHHFDGKEDIIAYVSRAAFESVFSDIEALLDAKPLPSPGQVIKLISERLKDSDVSPGFIVQIWGEAVVNPTVKEAANAVYSHALGFLREYITVWLTNTQNVELRAARAQADSQAALVLSLVYSNILHEALIDSPPQYTYADAFDFLS